MQTEIFETKLELGKAAANKATEIIERCHIWNKDGFSFRQAFIWNHADAWFFFNANGREWVLVCTEHKCTRMAHNGRLRHATSQIAEGNPL